MRFRLFDFGFRVYSLGSRAQGFRISDFRVYGLDVGA
jgi:hypothetical protein